MWDRACSRCWRLGLPASTRCDAIEQARSHRSIQHTSLPVIQPPYRIFTGCERSSGYDLERYAQMGRLLEPFGGQLQRIDGDRAVYRVNGSTDQLRSQLGLAQLREVPADQVPAVSANGQASAPGGESAGQLRFNW